MKRKLLCLFLLPFPREYRLHVVSSEYELILVKSVWDYRSPRLCKKSQETIVVEDPSRPPLFVKFSILVLETTELLHFYLPLAVIEKKGASKEAGSPFRKYPPLEYSYYTYQNLD